jgi:fucose permease
VTVFIIIGAGMATVLMGRIGPRPLVTVGPIIAAAGLLWLGLMLEPDSSYVTIILPAQILLAFGMGLTFPTLFSAAVGGIPQESTGVASGLLNASQQVGGSVGLALLTAVAAGATGTLASAIARDPATGFPLNPVEFTAYFGAVVDGWGVALVVASGFLFAAGIVMSLIIRGGKGAMPAGP